MSDADDIKNREIRTFVIRAARMSDAQTRAIETLLPRYGVDFLPESTFGAVFTDARRPFVIEIGFGMGVATVEIAQNAPERDFLGIEVHPPGVGNILKLIEAANLTNLRVMQHDAVKVLRHMVQPNSVDAFHIFFPDPWPKKRHHKRRLVQPALVTLLAEKLKPNGVLHLATDWEEYAQRMLDVLRGEPTLENTAVEFAPKPAWRPTTKFEMRGVNLGHGVWDVLFRKKP